jgi:hypothetical protein
MAASTLFQEILLGSLSAKMEKIARNIERTGLEGKESRGFFPRDNPHNTGGGAKNDPFSPSHSV